MRLFRALDRLSIGVDRYAVFTEERLKPQHIQPLINRGRIAVVQLPPLLVMLPEYEETFEELGITTLEELFSSESASVALKAQALALFQPEKSACVNCRR